MQASLSSFDGIVARFEKGPAVEYLVTLITDLCQSKDVTADDIHNCIPNITRDPRIIGAAFHIAKQRGIISPIGYVKSSRRECHNRPVVLWRHMNGK